MRLNLITAPAVKPVDVATARAHLELGGNTAHDAKITAMIDAAVAHLDGRDGVLGRCLIEQEWKATLDAFPCGPIFLPLPALRSVTSVKYVDSSGVEQTLAPAAYKVELGEQGAIWPVYGTSWPSTRGDRGGVTVQYVAGYGIAATDVPQALRSAILLIVGDLFENREGQGAPLAANPTVDNLIFPYRILRP